MNHLHLNIFIFIIMQKHQIHIQILAVCSTNFKVKGSPPVGTTQNFFQWCNLLKNVIFLIHNNNCCDNDPHPPLGFKQANVCFFSGKDSYQIYVITVAQSLTSSIT